MEPLVQEVAFNCGFQEIQFHNFLTFLKHKQCASSTNPTINHKNDLNFKNKHYFYNIPNISLIDMVFCKILYKRFL